MKKQKQEIIGYVRDGRQDGRTVTEILKTLEVPRSSYYRWVRDVGRKVVKQNGTTRTLTPVEKTAIVQAKEKNPEYRHRRIQGELQKKGMYISATSIYHFLRERGQIEPYQRRPNPLKYPSYEVIGRNLLWGCDWTKLLIAGIRWYLITLIDFFSRLWIEFEIVPTVNAAHVKALYSRGLLAQGLRTSSCKPILRTDRGSPNTSWVTREFFDMMGADLSWGRVRRPTDNAITERHYGTIKQEEIYLVGNYPDETTARRELGKYRDQYNLQRPHQALWNFTPQHVHELNNKTALMAELRQMKQKTLENRKNYWKTVNKSDLLLNQILSH